MSSFFVELFRHVVTITHNFLSFHFYKHFLVLLMFFIYNFNLFKTFTLCLYSFFFLYSMSKFIITENATEHFL